MVSNNVQERNQALLTQTLPFPLSGRSWEFTADIGVTILPSSSLSVSSCRVYIYATFSTILILDVRETSNQFSADRVQSGRFPELDSDEDVLSIQTRCSADTEVVVTLDNLNLIVYQPTCPDTPSLAVPTATLTSTDSAAEPDPTSGAAPEERSVQLLRNNDFSSGVFEPWALGEPVWNRGSSHEISEGAL